MEENFGFDAYGLSDDMPDPVARSIRSMLDHMHLVDERMNKMCEALKKIDSSYRSDNVPSISDQDVDCFREDAK
jgi:serine O-acetyltransferase